MLPNETMEHSAYKPSFSSGTGLLTTSIIATLYVGEVANVEVISLSVLEHGTIPIAVLVAMIDFNCEVTLLGLMLCWFYSRACFPGLHE